MDIEQYIQGLEECQDGLIKVVESHKENRMQSVPKLSIEYGIEDGFIFFMNIPEFDDWIDYLRSRYNLEGVHSDAHVFDVSSDISFKTYDYKPRDFPGATKEFNDHARREFCKELVFRALDLQKQLGISRVSSDDINNSNLPESLVRKVQEEYNISLEILSLGLYIDQNGEVQSEKGKLICVRNIANFVGSVWRGRL